MMSTRFSTRREFFRDSMVFGAGLLAAGPLTRLARSMEMLTPMQYGLVTYLWGKDWDLPALIANCTKSGVLGVELRTQHAHGVESSLNAGQRKEVKARFDDSPVTLVGLGTNYAFHYPDRDRLQNEIEQAKAYVRLSADCGGSGVKVKPNDLPKGVPYDKTIEQIGTSLNELGKYAADYGQEIRVEVHGRGTSALPVIKDIMDVADNPNVGVCWNCNGQDLEGEGLKYNFNLVRNRLAQTVHVREMNVGNYPYQELMDLFVGADYDGWILLEGRVIPDDRVQGLIEQKKIWAQMVAKAKGRQSSPGVTITKRSDKVTVEMDGQLFTEYCFTGAQRPYFYPVIGPTGERINRNWPMGDGPHEAHDHPHHKSLWFTHGDVNGVDFWADGDKKGNVVHEKFLELSSGPQVGTIKSQNKWVAPDGKVVCTDTRTHRFRNTADGQMIDLEVTIHASNGKLTFGDTKEGSMAIRLTPTMRLKGDVGKGHIVNSEGNRDNDTWGKRAAWCDYYGPVGGETVGVAILDHPDNPRHPTWWHVRNYGLFAANPFGVSYFEGKPRGTGDLTVPAGDSITFKWRFYIHKGNETEAKVAEHYRQYAASK